MLCDWKLHSSIVDERKKEALGLLLCLEIFVGWESEKVVVVTTGTNWALVLMERAKNIVVLCEPFCRIL